MRLMVLISVAIMLLGCAAPLKQIDSPDQSTYVYGYAEISGASKFQINLKNAETGKRHAYSKSWMSVPFMKKEILFAFHIDPGHWVLESVIASKGGQTVIPTGYHHTFEVVEGKGNYMGVISSTVNPFSSLIDVANDQRAESKQDTDAKMSAEFPTFEAANTVLIAFQKK